GRRSSSERRASRTPRRRGSRASRRRGACCSGWVGSRHRIAGGGAVPRRLHPRLVYGVSSVAATVSFVMVEFATPPRSHTGCVELALSEPPPALTVPESAQS